MSSLNLVINEDRDGHTFSISLLKSILGLLSGVGDQEYISIFINPFLSATETYYKHEGNLYSLLNIIESSLVPYIIST